MAVVATKQQQSAKKAFPKFFINTLQKDTTEQTDRIFLAYRQFKLKGPSYVKEVYEDQMKFALGQMVVMTFFEVNILNALDYRINKVVLNY